MIGAGVYHTLFKDCDLNVWKLKKGMVAPELLENLPRTVAVAAHHHSLFLDEDGFVWSCGDNQRGQLGLGHRKHVLNPTKIENLPPIRAIATGFQDTSLFLDNQGLVWGCGDGSSGSLCYAGSNYTPRQLVGVKDVTQISCGLRHNLFLDSSARVWGIGSNREGQRGSSEGISASFIPNQIKTLPSIKKISTCYKHSLFLDEEAFAWACGTNSNGEVGVAPTDIVEFPVKLLGMPPLQSLSAGYIHSLFLDNSGQPWHCGKSVLEETFVPTKIAKVPPVIEVQNGNECFYLIDENFHVWACGKNVFGPLDSHVPFPNKLPLDVPIGPKRFTPTKSARKK